MASSQIVDVDSLLEPISEDNPAGTDIRDDTSPSSPFYAIKDARNAARAAERNSLFDGGSSEADDNWRKIMELAPDILRNNAKDLEIASWYTEALVRRYGFQGLRDGFILLRGLIEQYWENLYPMPDEDGIETRVASLIGLNGEGAEGVLIAPIRNAPITEGTSTGPYNFWQYQQALDVQKITDEEQRAEKAAKVGFTVDDIEKAVAESSDSFYVDIMHDLERCIDEYSKTSDMLDQHCGIHEAPPTSNILSVLEDCLGAVKHIGKHKLPVVEEESEASADAAASDAGGTATTSAARGPVQSREQAFRQLAEISDFFRKTEPHSPISYVLEKAVKWGDMSLSELIRELIPDSSSREYFGSLTGVKTDEEY
jgi:type VI secretion system protein ImpA